MFFLTSLKKLVELSEMFELITDEKRNCLILKFSKNSVKKVGLLFIVGWLVGCGSDSSLSQLQIEQLGKITIGNGLAIHPDGHQLMISKPSGILDSISGREFYRIYKLEWKDDQWSEPEPMWFASAYNDYHPVFSPDGKWVYFNSNRPPPMSDLPAEKMNIWRVKFDLASSPEFLSHINTENHESYPTVAADGTLYFNSDRPGGKGSMDIYKASLKSDGFETPVLVPELNTSDSENDLAVDPQQRFLILNRYHFNTREISLYISQWQGMAWSIPEFLKTVNSEEVWELTPTLSPNGDYFFYEVEGHVKSIKVSDL